MGVRRSKLSNLAPLAVHILLVPLRSVQFSVFRYDFSVVAKFGALVHLVWTLFANISVYVRVCGVCNRDTERN